MKFIIDQQLPPDLAVWLESKAHSAEHVSKVGLGASKDRVIWEYAAQHSCVILTKDADFAERRIAIQTGPTIVWLRIRNSSKRMLLQWLERRWARVERRLALGDTIVEVR